MFTIKKLKKEEEENPTDNRVGKRWFPKEEGLLKSLIEKGHSITEIANKLERREGGIKSRILKMASEMQKNGQSLSEIKSKLVYIDEEELKRFQQSKNDKELRRKDTKDDNLTTTLLTQILTNQLEMNKKINKIMDDLPQ